MITHNRSKLFVVFSFVSLLLLSPFHGAQAQSKIEVEGDVSFVSDYSLRGLSRSNGGVAAQANMFIYSEGPFSGGIFASSLDKKFLGHQGEVEFYINYGGSIGAYDYKFSTGFDTLHGSGNSTGYANFQASLARDFGLFYVNAGTSFSPSNREIGNGSSLYGYMDVEVPLPLSKGPSVVLGLHGGYENFEGPLAKWDWRAGLYMGLLDYELGLQYTGSSNKMINGEKAIIGSGQRFLVSFKRYF